MHLSLNLCIINIRINHMKLFSTFFNDFKSIFTGYNKNNVEKAFQNIIKNRANTLIKLDKYDTREIKKSKDLAQHTSVRSYLQKVQKLSS